MIDACVIDCTLLSCSGCDNGAKQMGRYVPTAEVVAQQGGEICL